MHRVLGFLALFSLISGAALLLGACGTSSPATTGSSASTGASAGPLITASTTTTAGPATTPTSTAKSGEVGTKGNPDWLWFNSSAWQQRSRELFTAAGEVEAALK